MDAHHRKSIRLLILLVIALVGFWLAENGHRSSWQMEQPTEGAGRAANQREGNAALPDPAAASEVNGESPIKMNSDRHVLIWVYVAGAVQNPDVYRLTEGARVYQAIEAAGGLLPDARPEYLNLAAPLRDGEKVWVPDHETNQPQIETQKAGQRLDINSASVDQLQQLPGIGPKLAAAIVSERSRNGPFRTLQSLTRVDGIGEKSITKLRDWLQSP